MEIEYYESFYYKCKKDLVRRVCEDFGVTFKDLHALGVQLDSVVNDSQWVMTIPYEEVQKYSVSQMLLWIMERDEEAWLSSTLTAAQSETKPVVKGFKPVTGKKVVDLGEDTGSVWDGLFKT